MTLFRSLLVSAAIACLFAPSHSLNVQGHGHDELDERTLKKSGNKGDHLDLVGDEEHEADKEEVHEDDEDDKEEVHEDNKEEDHAEKEQEEQQEEQHAGREEEGSKDGKVTAKQAKALRRAGIDAVEGEPISKYNSA
eukprot:TRINITY_DN238_c0_g1_i1.p1 TRINITY_DN238_c0_g1~~TRINITY_DN238_c0_g1_i1.p1  ORF type:complete len:137 (+),score=47.49 TRINITY_DN238_c0_g1_i1:87-497(+)